MEEEMHRMEHLIWDEKLLALGLVNPQRSSPSTLLNKDCTVCVCVEGELKTAVCECVCVCVCVCEFVSSQATVQPALHRHE